MLIRAFLERLDKELVKVVYVFNTNISFHGVLKVIYRELGIAVRSDDLHEPLNHLNAFLTSEHEQGRNVVLVIDEAHNLPVTTLDYLRMLSNMETNGEKLLQILLVGQSEIEEVLDLDELKRLKQCIAMWARLVMVNRTMSREGGKMEYDFLLDTYETERLKTLSVWSIFTDADLPIRPHPLDKRDRNALEYMVHQCLSEDRWFRGMFGIDVGAPPLPDPETRLGFRIQNWTGLPANSSASNHPASRRSLTP